jgi:hypothetical protein
MAKGASGESLLLKTLHRSKVEAKADFAKRISAGIRCRSVPQVLQAQKQGERPFELAVEMDLIAPKPLSVC